MKILGSFTSILILSAMVLTGLTLILTACGVSKAPPQMVCQHPAINNGTPLVMPPGVYTNERGQVIATNNGVTVVLNGAVCVTASTKN